MNIFSIIANDLISKDKGKILIENIALNVRKFSTLPGEKTDTALKFQINKKGKIDISGKIGVNPLNCDINLLVDQVYLPGFQPFISEHLNLIVSKGKFSSKGRFTMEKLDATPIKAMYKGDIDVKQFLVLDSHKTEKLIGFKKFGVKKAVFKMLPFSGDINTVTIKDPVLNVAVYSDGSLNLTKIVKMSEQDKTSIDKKENNAKSNDSPLSLKIGKVIMENGTMVFNDKSVTPGFKTSLTKTNAMITGLSSEETIESALEIKAMVNNHIPIEIKGKINPLKTDFFCDMIVACSDMDLAYLSPYAGKYAGYKIKKGKLSLDLKYLVDKQQLDSTNKVFLDQFEFGQQVESEDAIDAPVTLAVALLKDTSGMITLDIPVKGDLNDPEFSVAGIILKIIVNLVMKAATAPFALLGSMFGGGEDLNIIAFDAGSFNITPQAGKKVETLVKALSERPGLNLEIAGYVDIDKDKQALKKIKFEALLKTKKLEVLLKQGKPAIPIDEIKLSDEEFDSFLKKAFLETKDGKEIKKEAYEKLSQEQIIQGIKQEILVENDELKALADSRALAIKGAILADETIEPKRTFLVKAKTLEPEQDNNGNRQLVIMTLK